MDIQKDEIIQKTASYFKNTIKANGSDQIRILQKIQQQLEPYDLEDVLGKIVALKLLPQNQCRTLRIDCLIDLIMIMLPTATGNAKMSAGKLKNIIGAIGKLRMCVMEDPCESLFVVPIQYYGNYHIFEGICQHLGYSFQTFLNAMHTPAFGKYTYNEARSAAVLSTLACTVSEHVYEGLGYDRIGPEPVLEDNLFVPSNDQLDSLKELLIIDDTFLESVDLPHGLLNDLCQSEKLPELEEILQWHCPKYYATPFVKTRNGKYLLLDLSALAIIAMHRTILYFKKTDRLHILCRNIAQEDQKRNMMAFAYLGHQKIKEEHFGISLLREHFYTERLLGTGSNQVILYIHIADEGTNYSSQLFEQADLPKNIEAKITSRATSIKRTLLEHGIEQDNINVIIIGCSLCLRISSLHGLVLKSSLCLNGNELLCIAINEHQKSSFLPRFIRARERLPNESYNMNGPFSILNMIGMYSERNNSFYISDDIDQNYGMIILGPDYAAEYQYQAVASWDRHLRLDFTQNFYHEVVCHGKKGVFSPLDSSANETLILLEISAGDIWIEVNYGSNIKETSLCTGFADLICYWIMEIERTLSLPLQSSKKIVFELSAPADQYGIEKSDFVSKNFEDATNIEVIGNEITLKISPLLYWMLGTCIDNEYEKQYIYALIDAFGLKAYINSQSIEKIFTPQYKRRFVALRCSDGLYFKPLKKPFQVRNISSADKNELLDGLGFLVQKEKGLPFGSVPTSQRGEITNFVVDHLYCQLQSMLKGVCTDELVRQAYQDLEIIIYHNFLNEKKYAIDVICNPEEETDLLTLTHSLHEASIAVRFFIEYVVACPNHTGKHIGEIEYERILACCCLIIEWAYQNDLFYFSMISSPVSILRSGRVGIEKEKIIRMNKIAGEAQKASMAFYSMPQKNDILIMQQKEQFSWEDEQSFREKISIGMDEEYGFSLYEWQSVIESLLEIGEKQEREVKQGNFEEIQKQVLEKTNLATDLISKVLQSLILQARENYLTPPAHFRKEDIYPWRFNRQLSVIRRPLLLYENTLIWGTRNLYHSMRYFQHLINSGMLKTNPRGKLSKAIGEISNIRGERFNKIIFDTIKEYKGIIVDKGIKKINHKKIADDAGNVLGDIDILAIWPDGKKIFAIEVKDFGISKNPYELHFEYEKLFVGDACFSKKHERRVDWLKNHIADIESEYKVSASKWFVKKVIISNSDIISNSIFSKGENILSIATLSEMRLKSC